MFFWETFMKEKIKSFKELHEALDRYRGNSLWLF